jgi:hypothetical protein
MQTDADSKIKEREMGVAHSTHGRDEKRVQKFKNKDS